MIRFATVEDCAAIAEIVETAYAVYIPRIGRKPAPMLDDHAALIAARRTYVFETKGAVAGALVLLPQNESMLVHNVAVAPAFQKRGLGRRLLAFAESVAISKKYSRLDLYTNEAMVENIALYARLGYVETRRSEESGFWRVHMSKALTGGPSKPI